MTILAIVNASKEGQIESKMLKSRHMEEIREARRKETEARQEQKKSKLVCEDEWLYCDVHGSNTNSTISRKKPKTPFVVNAIEGALPVSLGL